MRVLAARMSSTFHGLAVGTYPVTLSTAPTFEPCSTPDRKYGRAPPALPPAEVEPQSGIGGLRHCRKMLDLAPWAARFGTHVDILSHRIDVYNGADCVVSTLSPRSSRRRDQPVVHADALELCT
jgi:hypothetical protein